MYKHDAAVCEKPRNRLICDILTIIIKKEKKNVKLFISEKIYCTKMN